MPIVCQSYVLACHTYVICMSLVSTRMLFICHSYLLVYYLCALVCHSYVTRMYSYEMVCHSYVVVSHPNVTGVCHPYITRMYSYFIRMSLVCTRMSSVCHSYVLLCHPHVAGMYSYVIRMSLVCDFTMNPSRLSIF